MTSPYPRNADAIVSARRNGMKPAGPVLISLTKQYRALPDDAIVYADPGQTYRWDWIKGLTSVVVLIDAKTKLGPLLADLESCEPNQIDVVDVERRVGWMVGFVKHGLATIRWTPHQVRDWLGSCEWHEALHKAKRATCN